MKTFNLLCLALILLVSCKKDVDNVNNTDPETETNPPISATPLIKDYPGFLGMRSNAAFLTSDKSIVICGTDSTPDGFSHGKFKVMKIARDGAVDWDKTFKIGDLSKGSSLTEINGSYYVCGKVWFFNGSNSSERHRIFLTKMNASGDTLWTKYYTINHSDQSDCKVIKTSDNNLIIAGDAANVINDPFAMKVNQSGDIMWSYVYPIGTESTLRNIFETKDGDYIITGQYTDNTHEYYNTFFLKLSSSGAKLWDKKTDLERFVYSSTELPDGSILSTGYRPGVIDGSVQADLVKCDNAGNIVWQKDYGRDDITEVGHSVKYNSNNTITVGGISQGQFYMVNTDMSGNVLWEKRFGPTALEPEKMTMLGDKLDNNILFGFSTILVQLKPLPAFQERISTIYYTKLDKDGNYY